MGTYPGKHIKISIVISCGLCVLNSRLYFLHNIFEELFRGHMINIFIILQGVLCEKSLGSKHVKPFYCKFLMHISDSFTNKYHMTTEIHDGKHKYKIQQNSHFPLILFPPQTETHYSDSLLRSLELSAGVCRVGSSFPFVYTR